MCCLSLEHRSGGSKPGIVLADKTSLGKVLAHGVEGHSVLTLRPRQEVTVSGGCQTTSERSSQEGEGHLSTPGGTAAPYLRSDGEDCKCGREG